MCKVLVSQLIIYKSNCLIKIVINKQKMAISSQLVHVSEAGQSIMST